MKKWWIIIWILVSSCAHHQNIPCYDKKGKPAGTVKVDCEKNKCTGGFIVVNY